VILMKKNDIFYLVGDEFTKPLVNAPYSDIVCDFLNELSLKLLREREYSDIVSLGFFCRKSNILKLKQSLLDDKRRLGRGMILHITPGNVPVNFAFSFVFGLLSGNANIVRVPPNPFAQTKIICDAINTVFENEKYDRIKQATAFVDYPIDNEITAYFSEKCSGRIIWGGDRTIQAIRSIPIMPRGVEVAFADRYSFCIMNADEILKASEEAMKTLAVDFYNDTLFIDQNACSSPHLVIWQGKEKAKAKERFWQFFFEESQKYTLEPIKAMDKYTMLLEFAIDSDIIDSIQKYDNLIYCIKLKKLPENAENLRGKFGLFYEYDSDDFNEITPVVTSKFQTVTYFGIDAESFGQFVIDNALLGIDRIVPVGKALDIGVIWDGYDIIETLSRILDVK